MDINGNIITEDKEAAHVLLSANNNATAPSSPNSALFPIIQRPSGLIPRQNSGINSILDTDLVTSPSNKNVSSASTIFANLGKSGQIRTSYQPPNFTSRRHPSPAHRPIPVSISNLLQQRMRQRTSPSPVALRNDLFNASQEQVHSNNNIDSKQSAETELCFSTRTSATQRFASSVCSIADVDQYLASANDMLLAAGPTLSLSETNQDSTKNSEKDVNSVSTTTNDAVPSLSLSQTKQNSSGNFGKNVSSESTTSTIVVSPVDNRLSLSQTRHSSTRSSENDMVHLNVRSRSKSREIRELPIITEDPPECANLNINFTVQLNQSSVAGFGLRNGSQPRITHIEDIKVDINNNTTIENTSSNNISIQSIDNEASNNASIGNIDSNNASIGNIDSNNASTGNIDSNNNLSIDKINSNDLSIDKITSNKFSIDQINSNILSIDQINSKNLSIDQINSNKFSIDQINSNNLSIDQINSNNLSIDQINSNNLSIDQINSNILSIDQINSKNTSIGNIHNDNNIKIDNVNNNTTKLDWGDGDLLNQESVIDTQEEEDVQEIVSEIDCDQSCVSSVLSSELVTDSQRVSTTDIIYNAVLSAIGLHPSSTVILKTAIPTVQTSTNPSSTQAFGNPSYITLQDLPPSFTGNTGKFKAGGAESKDNSHTTVDSKGSIKTTPESSSMSLKEKKESRAFILPLLLNALKMVEITGDSIGSAASSTFSLLSNIVPQDKPEYDEEQMNACESDLPIQVMKLLGVPKTTRHDIYSEVSGEVEALQELGSGTYEALATVIKWVCGGKKGRDDFLDATRALCSVLSEVDLDSEVWNRVNAEVVDIKEAMDDAIQDGADTAEFLGDSLLDLVQRIAKSVPNSSSKNLCQLQVCRSKVAVEKKIEIEKVGDEGITSNDNVTPTTVEMLDESTSTTTSIEATVEVDINNNPIISSESQQFVPSQEEISDIGNDDATVDVSKVKEVLHEISEGSLMYDPVKGSQPAYIEQSSLSSSVQNLEDSVYEGKECKINPNVPDENNNISPVLVGLPNLENFFSKRVKSGKLLKKVDDESKSINRLVKLEQATNSISSAEMLSKLPAPPPNSEAIFDSNKYESKVIQDMTKVSKLVQELHDDIRPLKDVPPSSSATGLKQTSPSKLIGSTPCQISNPSPQSKVQSKLPRPIAHLRSRIPVLSKNKNQRTCIPINKKTPILTLQKSQKPEVKPEVKPQPQQLKSYPPRPQSKNSVINQSKNSVTSQRKNSTVSLYQSSKGSNFEKSFIQCNPLGHKQKQTPSAFSYQRSAQKMYNEIQNEHDGLIHDFARSSTTSVYSIGGESVPSRSFLKHTAATAAKARTRMPEIGNISNTTVTLSNVSSNSSRISTNISSTALNDINRNQNINWLSPKISTSTLGEVQVPQSTYQEIFQKKNSAIRKQCLKSGFGGSKQSQSSKPRFRF